MKVKPLLVLIAVAFVLGLLTLESVAAWSYYSPWSYRPYPYGYYHYGYYPSYGYYGYGGWYGYGWYRPWGSSWYW